MSPILSPAVLPILLLIGSNVFMTLAWYGHLRFKDTPLFVVIAASWGVAFLEYCMAVPANRWGSAVYSTAQLNDNLFMRCNILTRTSPRFRHEGDVWCRRGSRVGRTVTHGS
jgi:uncharacterized protein (DUF486 family)